MATLSLVPLQVHTTIRTLQHMGVLVPARVANKTWRNLADQITRVDSSHLDTGLTGTYFMTKLLMESGRNDLVRQPKDQLSRQE